MHALSRARADQRRRRPLTSMAGYEETLKKVRDLRQHLPEGSEGYNLAKALEEAVSEESQAEQYLTEAAALISEEIAKHEAAGGTKQVKAFLDDCARRLTTIQG